VPARVGTLVRTTCIAKHFDGPSNIVDSKFEIKKGDIIVSSGKGTCAPFDSVYVACNYEFIPQEAGTHSIYCEIYDKEGDVGTGIYTNMNIT